MINPNWIVRGFQQINSLVAATPLTLPVFSGTGIVASGGPFVALAIIRCETQPVRWRDDGVAPTSAIGMLMNPGDNPLFYYGNIAALQFIQTAATAVLDISYYG